MTAFVVDASATMAWFFEDEANPEGWALLERAQRSGFVVPAFWPLEVGNIMAVAERRRRTTAARIAAFVGELQQMPLTIDPISLAAALGKTLELARSERLTTYDAAYLELAMRRNLPLATKDVELREAALRLGVELALA